MRQLLSHTAGVANPIPVRWVRRPTNQRLDLHAATWTTRTTYEIRPDARRFGNWETNVAAKLGLGEAVNYALGRGIGHTWPRIQWLANRLRCSLPEYARYDLPHCQLPTLVRASVHSYNTDTEIDQLVNALSE